MKYVYNEAFTIILVLFLTFGILLPSKLFAQNDSILLNPEVRTASVRTDTTFGRRLSYDLKNIFGGVVYTYAAPLHWKKENLPAIGAFVAGTTALLFMDEGAAPYFKKQGDGIPIGFHHAGWYMGKPQYNYSVTAGIYLTGLITKSEKLRHAGVLIISSATAGGLIQTVSKSIAGRARPNADYGNMHFKPFASEAKYHSFPSGHTILSTTAIYAISKQFSNPWAKAGILSVGLLTPVSRLWDSAHWISDVGLGIGISVLTVEAVDHFLKKNEKYELEKIKDPKRHRISWNFRAGYNQAGIVGVF
ncbi:phosphatase PAP2 family protein [Flavobacterium psychrotrophum]|uniref:phosphatase PAP2 family protein n=1 Tax=Flavobacterium psychrotrophum TaxID=2294119 RepID=UPI000E312774|nr:phosphatase PAP2 family protein [Flavobacterium psychrotrophum]